MGRDAPAPEADKPHPELREGDERVVVCRACGHAHRVDKIA